MEEVKITSTEMLKPVTDPVEIPESGKLKLSVYDWTMRYAQFQRRVLFYSSVHSDIMDLLKNSLSQALVSFFPMAARLSPQKTCFILDCTNMSVQFSEAITDSRISDIQQLEFSPSSFCDKLCAVPPWPWSRDDPLLFVQVTRFADHGLSIGIAFSHHICDGVSAWHFFNSWSQLAKLGKLLNPPEVSFVFNGLSLTSDETAALGECIGFRRRNNLSTPPSFTPASELDTKIFKLDSEDIAKLKKTASDVTRFTSYEVVVAHFWMQITAARSLPPDKRVQLFLLFNCRERFGGLAKNYFGNAISMAIVSCTAKELVNGGLGRAAGLLHESISGFDERKNQAFLNIVEEALAGRGFVEELDVDPEGFSLVVSSPRHPVYECDFGFGKPVGATFGTNDLHEGKIYLFPSPRDPAGIDVRIVLRHEQLSKASI